MWWCVLLEGGRQAGGGSEKEIVPGILVELKPVSSSSSTAKERPNCRSLPKLLSKIGKFNGIEIATTARQRTVLRKGTARCLRRRAAAADVGSKQGERGPVALAAAEAAPLAAAGAAPLAAGAPAAAAAAAAA
eukprot:CAMPEP_0206504632 /NCGR_PEP_ID=MMETSP0324_2-20121206/55618_1 /ASSEMBLY_ACC=CAM_ASM_000836 /TAXON_ID=2866 /ORGANISM="Crypthecodinium cohnii, Strain Seligo" /LENGTH=132 /DNA_ID=CAMNT_0053993873 /DNA_START=212 /DNA_END=608 /DNA_ORIENTATION=+